MIRICLTGVESTGKTWASVPLAQRLGGAVLPEFGREWAETIGHDYGTNQLRAIARIHAARRARLIAGIAATRGPRLIIEDTDVVMTQAWHVMLHGHRDPVLGAMPADANAYLLFSPDVPWLADGTRAFGGDERARFHAVVQAELALRSIASVVISGTWQQRLAQAGAAIADVLASAPGQRQ